MHPATSLSISTKTAINRSQEIITVLNARFSYIVFYPELADSTDLQAKQYCSHIQAIKEYASNMNFNKDLNELIKSFYTDIPDFQESDFEFDLFQVPSFIYYLILPIGILCWIVRYNKLCRVRDKLGLALSKMNTADFYLKG
jgi:hypothetical protein